MEEGSKQYSQNPPSTTRLANLLKNPDLLSMNVNYQSTREAFLDIAYQLDDFQKTMTLFEEAESRYMKTTDMKSIYQNIQNINVQMDRNTEDLSTEIRELRQYFSFQIKELNSKVDNNLTNVINELTKPIAAAPAPANSGEASIYDAEAYKSMKSEMDNLKERFESLMEIITKPMTEPFDGEEEEEINNENNVNNKDEGESKENNMNNDTQSPEAPEKEPVANAPAPAKGEDNSIQPNSDNGIENSNAATSNEENLDLNKSQSSTSSSVKFEKSVNESISTPSLVTAKQLAANLKPNSINAFKRIIEMRLDDIKIQLNKINTQITENEEKLNPLIPVVQRNSAENSVLRPELMKIKADVMLLKGDIDIMKDLQANSSVDFMKSIREQVSKVQSPAVVDVEKPLTAMRSQIMQQFARMENAFNEQLKKLKAELIGIRNLASSNSQNSNSQNESGNQSLLNDDDQIKIVDSFANEEPAEKVLIQQMQKEAEEERKKKEEELDQLTKDAQEAATLASAKSKEEREKEAELIKKNEEEKFLQKSSRIADLKETENSSDKNSEKVESTNSLKQAEVETDADESSKFHYNKYTEVKNLPNQLIVSVLADLPPRIQKVIRKDDEDSAYFADDKETSNNYLNVYPTVAFEYARIGSSSDDDLESVKKDIQCHQEIIEKIVSQITDTGDKQKIEVPTLSSVSSQEKDEFSSLTEIKALKDASSNHQRSIDDLNQKVDQLIKLSNYANLTEEEKKDKKILEEIIQHQNELKQLQSSSSTSNSSNYQQRQIVLSPVHFTPLNLQPLKVYKAKSSKEKSSSKSKQNKTESTKPKNPKKPKKQPNKEAPAPALSSKTKEETSVTIEVPPKPSSLESKEKVQSPTSTSLQQKQEEELENNKNQEEQKENENIHEDENENETNNIEDTDLNENYFDDENQEIYQNENEIEETHKSSKSSSHRSGSHHSSRHSSRHHSPSHHSSSRSPKNENKTQEETEKNLNEKKKEELETENKNQTEINQENNKIKTEEEEEEKIEKEKTLIDDGEEEEEDQHHSNNSVEFFSPADSSVGSSVVFESHKSNWEEEEEEEEEGMDPIIAEKLSQLSDLLNSHQEQIKNIREGLVEIRSHVQQVKMEIKDQRSTLLLPLLKENSSVESLERTKSSADISQQIGDDNAIRAVRRRFDMQTREFENELYEIRKEIMEIRLEQSKAPQTVTERIIQVPMNGYNQQNNQQNLPSSPENNNDDDDAKGKLKGKKDGIFSDENKLLEIKPLSLPNNSNTPNKIPKLPIIDQQPSGHQVFTPSIFSAQQGAPLIVTNTKQTRTQPTTPKQKKLPPILPTASSATANKKENDDQTDIEIDIEIDDDENKKVESNLTQNSSSARVGNNNNEHHPFFNNVVQQSIDELNVLNAANDVDEHILNLVIEVRSQLMLAIDKNTKRLNQVEAKIDNFVDKDYVQKFFQKMRAVITDVNSSVNSMKQALPERVTKDEMQNLIEELYHSLTSDQETSGGTSNYRCLLCGRPKTSISGMIRDFKVAESLGQPTQTTITQSPNAGARGTLIYGPDKQMYRGKGNFGRPTIATSDSKKQLPKMK